MLSPSQNSCPFKAQILSHNICHLRVVLVTSITSNLNFYPFYPYHSLTFIQIRGNVVFTYQILIVLKNLERQVFWDGGSIVQYLCQPQENKK